MKALNCKTLFLAIWMSVASVTVPIEAQAYPFERIAKSCQQFLIKFFSFSSRKKRMDYTPPKESHPGHLEAFKLIQETPGFSKQYPHLPHVNQSFKNFKNTDGPFIEYYLEAGDWKDPYYKEFVRNTIEIIYTPHSSLHGHVRLRIGKRVFGFESVQRVFDSNYEPSFLFKQERKMKRGKKAGNLGVVFVMSDQQKQIVAQKIKDIENFYFSSRAHNFPPFDGKGEKNVKIIEDESTGQLKFHSSTPPSGFGNRRKVNAQLETTDGQEYLVAPSGLRQVVRRNEEGERVTEAFSCASSACHIMNHYLGMNIRDMPYAGSFVTHLKNGAEGFLKPDAIIHYYPESDL